MRLRTLTASGIVAGLVLVSMALGVAAPAQAAGLGSIYNAYQLLDYRSTVSGAELYAENPANVQEAWGSNAARMITRGAIQSSSGLTYGLAQLTPDAIPIKQLPDVPIASQLAGRWKTPTFTGVGLNKPSGVVGATVAMTAYQYRASIADGVTSWLGVDATGSVCGSSWASTGFVNFLTGQDCDGFANDLQASQQNTDVSSDYGVGAPVCNVGSSFCLQGFAQLVTGSYNWSGNVLWGATQCLQASGTPPTSGANVLLVYQYGGVARYMVASAAVAQGSTPAVHPCAPLPGVSLLANAPSQSSLQSQVASMVPECFVPTTSAGGAPTGWQDCTAAGSVQVVSNGGDPDRTIACTYTFSDGTTATGTTPTFKESDGSIPAPVCPIVPSGLTATHMKIVENGGGQSNVLVDQDAAPDPLTTVPSGFTSNAPAGVDSQYCQTNYCILDLVDLKSGDSCFNEAATCDGWFTDANRATDYKCTYGGKDADMQQCYMYAHIFNTAKRVAGDPYADPMTGDDLGGGTGPSLDGSTMGNVPGPAINPDGSYASCLGGTYSSFNPIQWVLRPIQCGLEWAFVPRQSVLQSDVAQMQGQWNSKMPGQIAGIIGGIAFVPPTGCSGIAVPIDWLTHKSGQTMRIMAACPGDTLANVALWARIIGDVMFTVYGAIAVTRHIAGVVQYGGVGGGGAS